MKLTGEILYCNVARPNTRFEKHFWSVSLILTPETRAIVDKAVDTIWQEHDSYPSIRQTKDGEAFVTVKKNCLVWDMKIKGYRKQSAPYLLDKDGAVIGNDPGDRSLAEVEFEVSRWSGAKYGSGISLGLLQVLVLRDSNHETENYQPPRAIQESTENVDDDIPF